MIYHYTTVIEGTYRTRRTHRFGVGETWHGTTNGRRLGVKVPYAFSLN